MYIGKFGQGNNIYVRLMESYRDRTTGKSKIRVLKNFGRYEDLIKDDPLAYEKLKEKYRLDGIAKSEAVKLERQNYIEQILNSKSNHKDDISTFPILKYGHYILNSIWENDLELNRRIKHIKNKYYTNIEYDINEALKFLVFNNILSSESIQKLYSEKNCYLGDPLKGILLDNLYHCLEFTKEIKDIIKKSVNNSIDAKFGKDRKSTAYYDTINLFFESLKVEYEKNIKHEVFIENIGIQVKNAIESGNLSKDVFNNENNLIINENIIDIIEKTTSNKINYLKTKKLSEAATYDKQIYSIELISDTNGFPIDFNVYKNDVPTLLNLNKLINEIKNKYSIDHLLLSSDSETGSAQVIQLLNKHESGFNSVYAIEYPIIYYLSLIILRFIQIKLNNKNIKLSLKEICRAISGASVVAFGENFKTNQDKIFFAACEYKINNRYDAITDKQKNDTSLNRENKICNPLPHIMEAAGLSPLSGLFTRQELARSLRTRFPSPADAVPTRAFD